MRAIFIIDTSENSSHLPPYMRSAVAEGRRVMSPQRFCEKVCQNDRTTVKRLLLEGVDPNEKCVADVCVCRVLHVVMRERKVFTHESLDWPQKDGRKRVVWLVSPRQFCEGRARTIAPRARGNGGCSKASIQMRSTWLWHVLSFASL